MSGGLANYEGGGQQQRIPPLAAASAARIAGWGRLEADDGFLSSIAPPYDDWKKAQPKLYATPERCGFIIAHAANLAHRLGRRVNSDELCWSAHSEHGIFLYRSEINRLLDHCIHAEAKRMAAEWMGRLATRRRQPNWVIARLEAGETVDVVRSDVSLCAKLNGSIISDSMNEQINALNQSMYDDMDSKLLKRSAAYRREAEAVTARLALAASEVKGEVTGRLRETEKRIATEQRVGSLENKVEELTRIVHKKNRPE